jgi:hypothetical protein
MLPLYPPGGWPIQHFAGVEIGPGQRVNLGLFNGDAERTTTFQLSLYSSDGTIVAATEWSLATHDSVQLRLERFFSLEPGALPAGTYGLTVLPLDNVDGTSGRSWAYVSVIDNTTNDPINLW